MASYKVPINTSQLTTGYVTQFTCPAGATAEIAALGAINDTAASQTISIQFGGKVIVNAQTVPANNTVPGTKLTPLYETIGMSLNPAETLQALASAGTAIRLVGTMKVTV